MRREFERQVNPKMQKEMDAKNRAFQEKLISDLAEHISKYQSKGMSY